VVCQSINTFKRPKIGKIGANNDNTGKEWFSRWYELMAIWRCEAEIKEWHSGQQKLKGIKVSGGRAV